MEINDCYKKRVDLTWKCVMRDFARYFKQMFKTFMLVKYEHYHKLPNTYTRDQIVSMMTAEPILKDMILSENCVFYISALVSNKKLLRNRYALRSFKKADSTLTPTAAKAV
jgi:hypothetical protein